MLHVKWLQKWICVHEEKDFKNGEGKMWYNSHLHIYDENDLDKDEISNQDLTFVCTRTPKIHNLFASSLSTSLPAKYVSSTIFQPHLHIQMVIN